MIDPQHHDWSEGRDEMAPARGVRNGVLLALPIWALIGLVVWGLLW